MHGALGFSPNRQAGKGQLMDMAGIIAGEFDLAMQHLLSTPPLRFLAGTGFRAPHYASMLREIWHHAQQTPRLQTLALEAFHDERREALRPLFAAGSCGGVDSSLLTSDLQALGVSGYQAAASTPLATTTAFTAFVHYQLSESDPIGYLGYFWLMSFMPRRLRPLIAAQIDRGVIPSGAARFALGVSEVRRANDEQVVERFRDLVRKPRELSIVVHVVRSSGVLFASLLAGAIEEADRHAGDDVQSPEAAPDSLQARIA